ncbi:MAG TPA: DUF805 domain-containing protein [Actinobacteria bacterium]|jgi:uncharacterized membrane protein YhaH (DUF805 family)|nr:DUF805 domain-containing protein [Actinomycetota bacterium]
MGFGQAVRTCFGKYADFSGRAARPEFWWFFLFSTLVSLVATIPFYVLIGLLAASENGAGTGVLTVLIIVWTIIVVLLSIGLIIPLLAVGARRLHDYGQTAWLLLLYFIPCGNIALIVLWALDGTPGDNPYGPRPLQ